jgi:hypothetical protein
MVQNSVTLDAGHTGGSPRDRSWPTWPTGEGGQFWPPCMFNSRLGEAVGLTMGFGGGSIVPPITLVIIRNLFGPSILLFYAPLRSWQSEAVAEVARRSLRPPEASTSEQRLIPPIFGQGVVASCGATADHKDFPCQSRRGGPLRLPTAANASKPVEKNQP